ncbi:glycine cleavage system transcriptional activator [Grimontia indica]|uniref:Glycine cleavage system transcriptional activator n=2 Tax=Grimontia TaxID=246861 RepID=R1IRH8_9GAMM|nr:LysR substrate-binding domain-containing protein [Grimontia indica]EOD80087.1 glycine cleavage system transcriptional activator [Grimontia indica]
MPSFPSMNALRVFAAVGKYQSIQQAAKTLHISESAVSQQIKNLEERLQVQLIERVGRTIKLTEKGALFYPFIDNGMVCFTEGLDALETLNREKLVTISVIPSMAKWLIHRLPDFKKFHPEIRVRVHSSNIPTNETNTEVDLSLRFGLGNYPGMTTTPILHDKIVIVVAPSLLAEGAGINLSEYALSLPWLGYHAKDIEDVNQAIQRFTDDKTQNISKLASKIDVHDAIFVLEAAISGQGVAVTKHTLALPYLTSSKLHCLFEMPTFTAFRYFIVHPKKRPLSVEAETFQNWLMTALPEDFPELVLRSVDL